jgi:hypothetical protein
MTRRKKPFQLRLENLEARDVPATPIYAVGTDEGAVPRIKAYNAETNQFKYSFAPFANTFRGGVRVAVADVTGDAKVDILAGQGPGGNNRIRVFNGINHLPVNSPLRNLVAFSPSEANGIFVASADVNGDGRADAIIGTDNTDHPQVKIFDGVNGSLLRTIDLSDLNFSGGARVAAGDVNGDRRADIIVGSGEGGPAQVAVFDGANGALLCTYLPFGANERGGVNVAAGHINADTYADVIVGQADGGSQVRVYSGLDTASIWNTEAFAGWTGGVRVAAVDADQDGQLDVLAAKGSNGSATRVLLAGVEERSGETYPFGGSYQRGLFVAGSIPADADPIRVVKTDAIVTVTAGPDVIEGGTTYITFTFSRTGSTTNSQLFRYSVGGTATSIDDHNGGSGDYNYQLFPAGEPTHQVQFAAVGDTVIEGPETVVVTALNYPGTVPGSPNIAVVTIYDDAAPAPSSPFAIGLIDCTDPIDTAPGAHDLVGRPGDSGGINQALPYRFTPEQNEWMTTPSLPRA